MMNLVLRRPALLLAAAGALAGPAVAQAAEVHTDRRCYADPATRADTITLGGTGFTPNAGYQTTLDGQALNADQVAGPTGALSFGFPAPSLDALVGRTAMQHTFTVGAAEGTNSAQTTFTVSRLRASFAPSSGNPKTLKVRFSVYGFALASADPVDVYLHYVAPGGKLKKTYKLGRGQGDCGSLKSSKRRLFPFGVRRGRWNLQLDTSKAYRKGTSASTFLYFTIGVKVN